MNDSIAIGVDVGGSHISSAAVNLKELKIIPNTIHCVKLDNKASKEEIFKKWSEAINKTIESAGGIGNVNIGVAIPGPFNYKEGIAMFSGDNDKYDSLYNVSVSKELVKYINATDAAMRFLNDATSFGVGVSAIGKARGFNKIIAVTLGTGFGSAFIKNGVPIVVSDEVPVDGCLWDKPYKEGIGDDYFSTRWCIDRYQEITSKRVNGVKEIAEANDEHSKQVFTEFGSNMAEFMIPFIKKFQPGLIVLGGNISNASKFFLPVLEKRIKEAGLKTGFEISQLMEDAAIIGSAKLFDSNFWNSVKNDLPNL